MRNSNGCLTGLVAGGSRIFLLMVWFSRPVLWNSVFSSVIWPCLGFLFLPFTTLMYYVLASAQPGKPLAGIDWLWIILALIIDVFTIGAAGQTNRENLPASVPGSTAPPAA
ncbi:MAG TPA: hypothetical protein VK449_12560 [Anaerolineales bacterium]|nr:hypothetical protein [Anaerolineales bacterium]